MILSYSRTSFVPAIIQNIKKHTVRKTDSWKSGMKIHHWLGNPRNTKSTPPPFCFHEGVCDGTERVTMVRYAQNVMEIGIVVSHAGTYRKLDAYQILELCRNDGLTLDEFIDWFLPPGTEKWHGRIIHYTPLRYAK